MNVATLFGPHQCLRKMVLLSNYIRMECVIMKPEDCGCNGNDTFLHFVIDKYTSRFYSNLLATKEKISCKLYVALIFKSCISMSLTSPLVYLYTSKHTHLRIYNT